MEWFVLENACTETDVILQNDTLRFGIFLTTLLGVFHVVSYGLAALWTHNPCWLFSFFELQSLVQAARRVMQLYQCPETRADTVRKCLLGDAFSPHLFF